MPTAIKRAAKARPSLKRVSTDDRGVRPVSRRPGAMADSSRRDASGEEDLRDLNDAIVRNAGKPGTPWAKAKKELGLG